MCSLCSLYYHRYNIFYKCYIFLFIGCTLNKLVNWKLVCRTNTLGWEQCGVLAKEKETQYKIEITGDEQTQKGY